MNQFEERIQNILQEETGMPEVVNDKVGQVFDIIKKNNNGVMKQTKIKRNIRVAAITLAVILSVGTTTVAAVKHFGLLDYFNQRNEDLPKEAMDMIVDEVKQQEQSEEEKLVSFKVREYLCDANQVYIVVEAKSSQEQYFIIPEWVDEDDSINDIGITDMQGMSIAEYAVAQGKEILYANAYVDTDARSYSCDCRMEDDGTVLFIMSSANEIGDGVKEVTCYTSVSFTETPDMEDVIRDSFVFNMENNSEEKILQYAITDTSGADELGIVIDDIVMSETELGIHVEFLYHYAEDISKEQMCENEDICFQLLGENGEELESTPDAAGWAEPLDDGSFKEIRNYKKGDLPSELTIRLKNVFTKEEYGTVKMQKK